MWRPSSLLAPVVALASALSLAGAGALSAAPAAAAAAIPTVVAIRAAAHPGYDRVVFEFRGGLPARRDARYVPEVLGGGSGEPIQINGRAKLRVLFATAMANDGAGHPTAPIHTAYDLKQVHEVNPSGDLDGVVSYGIGLAKVTSLRTFTLRSPDRYVIDISTDYRAVPISVWLTDYRRTGDGAPVLRAVHRQAATPAVGAAALDRIFAGGTPAEMSTGVRMRSYTGTDWTRLSVDSSGIARVRLNQCTPQHDIGLAEEIMLTLKQFPAVRAVKIYDQDGTTQRPTGVVDSVPWCWRT